MRLASSLPSGTPQHRSTVNDFNFDSVASRARQKRFCKLIIDKKDVTINSTGSEAASAKGWVAWAPIFWEHFILERDAYESLHERSLVDPHGFWGEAADAIDWYKRWRSVLSFDDHGSPLWFASC
jgi:hypothetical protein